jgi:hypothetical protein
LVHGCAYTERKTHRKADILPVSNCIVQVQVNAARRLCCSYKAGVRALPHALGNTAVCPTELSCTLRTLSMGPWPHKDAGMLACLLDLLEQYPVALVILEPPCSNTVQLSK